MLGTMQLKNLVKPKQINIDLNATNKDDAINQLALLLEQGGIVTSINEFTEAVYERETLTTTAIGFGVAIPHAKSSSVIEPGVAIGRSPGFSWDQETDFPINLVFLLAVPERIESPEYMGILASISRMLVHEEFRNSLIEAKDINKFISIISNGTKYLVNQ